MKTIYDDPNIQMSNKLPHLKPSSTAEQIKAQEKARTTIVNGASLHPMTPHHVYSEAENEAIRKAHISKTAQPKNNSSLTGK